MAGDAAVVRAEAIGWLYNITGSSVATVGLWHAGFDAMSAVTMLNEDGEAARRSDPSVRRLAIGGLLGLDRAPWNGKLAIGRLFLVRVRA